MTSPEVETVDAGARKVSRRIVVAAPAATVFALIADPHRHPELDGSGTLRDTPVSGPELLTVGAKFSVAMKQYGVPYKITSTVTAFEQNRVLEWRHPAGHRWRWEIVELDPTTTQVTETFDYTTNKMPRILEVLGFPKKNGDGITETLRGLSTRFA
jgi:uncharacterized protein YndB with AHSA1/START domain